MSTQTKTAPAPVDRRSPRILVVDDERSMRELMAIVLRREGYDVLLAENGRSAIDLLQREPVDLLISDIKMPDEDGYALMRSLRSAGISTPAIALTAFARREDADEARAAGFQVHLAKPVDSRLLVDAAAQLLESGSVH